MQEHKTIIEDGRVKITSENRELILIKSAKEKDVYILETVLYDKESNLQEKAFVEQRIEKDKDGRKKRVIIQKMGGQTIEALWEAYCLELQQNVEKKIIKNRLS